MKITIIGCGWLGFPLAKKLVSIGNTVVGSTQNLEKYELLKKAGITPILYTLGDLLERKIIEDTELLVITIPPNKHVDYSKSIDHLISQFPKNISVVFTSSIGVYLNSNNLIDENAPIIENHPVFLTELLIKNRFENSIILRLAGLIGENRNPIFSLSGKEMNNSNQVVNLVDQYDIIAAIELIIINKIKVGTFNLCYPDHPTKKEYYSIIANKFNLELPLFLEGEKLGKIIDGSYVEKKLNFRYLTAII